MGKTKKLTDGFAEIVMQKYQFEAYSSHQLTQIFTADPLDTNLATATVGANPRVKGDRLIRITLEEVK